MSSDEKRGQIHFSADPAALLAYVAQSPKLCAAHDKAGWVGLFARDAEVNDPVGSRPHRGREAIERFYDTFIAPNALAFSVEHDIVCGMSVMRDLSIESTMATGLVVSVPMHLRYDLVEEDGALKIQRLFAHWELPGMLAQQLSSLKGWRTSLELTPRLLKHQGFGGLFGFMGGMVGTGRAGRRTLEKFLTALSYGDSNASVFLAPGCKAELPAGTPVTPPQLGALVRGLTFRKLLGAGSFASATVEFGGKRGVVVARFDEGPWRISGVQVFA